MPTGQITFDPPTGSSSRNVESGGEAALDQVETKFIKLRDEWKNQRGHEPSTMKLVMLPAYQQIIGMGAAAVPLLLRELDANLDNWFWALMSITGENPVPEECRGDGKAMARSWLKWGKERGYEW